MRNQFIRFCCVGGIGFLIDAGTTHAFTSLLHQNPYLGRLYAFLIAATVTWHLNSRITFKGYSKRRLHSQWIMYVLLSAVGGSVNYTVYALCVAHSDIIYRNPVLGVAIGSAFGLLINFTMARQLVFDPSRQIIAVEPAQEMDRQ